MTSICILHRWLINSILNKAYEYECSNIMIPVGEERILYNAVMEDDEENVSLKEVVADPVYETHNVRHVKEIIQSHIRICNAIGNYPQCSMLINGEPGLGKTKVADYIAHNKICDKTYVFDMTRFRTCVFKDFIGLIDVNMSYKTDQKSVEMVMFDEIDKYLDFWVDYEYDKYAKLELESNKSNKNIVEIEEKESFERRKKKDFLYQLLELLETRNTRSYRIYVFCANNFCLFDKLSETDLVHLQSLKKRMTNIYFKLCDKQEIIRLFTYYNNIFKTKLPENYITPENWDETVDGIPDDIQISMRDLYQQLTINKYKLKTLFLTPK